jgi:hypothetical protein
MKPLWIMLLLLSAVGLHSPSPVGAAEKPISAISVNGKEGRGPVPFLYRAGMFLNEQPVGASFDTFFSELKPGAIEMIPIREGQFSTLREYVERLPSLGTTRWAAEVHKRGGRPVIGLMEVPRWLQQGGGDANLRPPKDWEGWARYVEATVRFFNGQLGLDAWYVVWDEPDLEMFWKGATEEDYFKLYRFSVLGARRADPKAKIGGPGVSAWTAKGPRSKGEKSLLFNFIRYASENSLPEVKLSRLPIDFVAWHQFDTDSKGSPLLYQSASDDVRGWLTQFGYDPKTELGIGSWNSWLNFGKDPNEFSPERDKAFTAAYVVRSLAGMDRAGIGHHLFFNLFEQWQWNGTPPARKEREFAGKEFIGGFGLFTKEGVIKPVFNAFKALSALEGERLAVETDDPYLTVLASKSGDQLVVLISNFVWPQEGMMRLKLRALLEQGYRRADLASWLKNLTPEMVQEAESGKRPIDSLPIPDDVKKRLDALRPLEAFYVSRDQAKTAELKLEPTPFSGKVRLERFLIDERHSNSFSRRADIEAMASQGRQEAKSDVGDLLIGWGLLKNGFRQLDEKTQAEALQGALRRLSFDQREKVKQAIQTSNDRFRQKISEVNRWEGVRLEKVEDRPSVDSALPLKIEMSPYSVHLIRMTRSG